MRILIVEDDREVAGNIAKMLRESGHVVDAPMMARMAWPWRATARSTC
jgi:DNA-binding response OmpR family regulator